METKHTPGPWMLDALEGAHWNIDAADGTAIALAQGHRSPAVRRANAALIASAPDLLEALEAFVGWAKNSGQYDKTDGVYSKALSAIAKARGEEGE